MAVAPIPPNTPKLIPHLTIDGDASEAIVFYKAALGAEERGRSVGPNGKIMHAEIAIGEAVVYLSDNMFGQPQPPSGVTLSVWVNDARSAWDRAVQAGMKVEMELADQFWGDRYGHLRDPFGHAWALMQRLENLTPEQIEQRAAEFFAKMGR